MLNNHQYFFPETSLKSSVCDKQTDSSLSKNNDDEIHTAEVTLKNSSDLPTVNGPNSDDDSINSTIQPTNPKPTLSTNLQSQDPAKDYSESHPNPPECYPNTNVSKQILFEETELNEPTPATSLLDTEPDVNSDAYNSDDTDIFDGEMFELEICKQKSTSTSSINNVNQDSQPNQADVAASIAPNLDIQDSCNFKKVFF